VSGGGYRRANHQVTNLANGTSSPNRVGHHGDVDAAVAAAREAQRGWGKRYSGDRATGAGQAGGVMSEHADELRREVSQTRKPSLLAVSSTSRGSIDNVGLFSGAAVTSRAGHRRVLGYHPSSIRADSDRGCRTIALDLPLRWRCGMCSRLGRGMQFRHQTC